jgi:hypothetical protein
MNALFAAFGVDYVQWRALTFALVKRDFRTRPASMGRAGRAGSTGARAIVSQLILYSVMGALLSIGLVIAKDVFFAGLLLSGYVMFMTGTAVLLDHSSALTAADDYNILGFRPISSRTYFAVRLTNVLVYTAFLTTLVSYIPVGVLFVRRGAIDGVAGLLAFYGSSFAVAFALLVGYGSLQRLVGANALKQVLSVVQLVMSFIVYGGYMLVTRVATASFLQTYTMPKTWWLVLLPPAWFASYFSVAHGQHAWIDVAPALLSVAAIAAMAYALSGWLAKGFSEQLADVSVAQATPAPAAVKHAPRTGGPTLFRSDEGRAMALLIRSQFRNDQKFRMGVLTILPLTALYIFQGITRTGGGADRPGGPFMLVGFAIMLFPAMLKMQFTRSDSFKASWIFFAAPVSRGKLITAAKNVLVAAFLVPYLVLVALAMAYATHDPLHAIAHVVLLGLASHLMLAITVLLDPELPFSRPTDKGGGMTRFMTLVLTIGVANVLLTVATPWLYGNWLRTGAVAGGIVVLTALAAALASARIDERTRKLEFVG